MAHLRKYHLKEDRALLAQLNEAPIVKSKTTQFPGWKPEKPWEGTAAKWETLIQKFGGKPYPAPFGEQAIYEMLVGNDYIDFFEDGEAYSTNLGKELGYGALKQYPGAIVIFSKKGETSESDSVEGYITFESGKPKWNTGNPAATDNVPDSVEGLQLALDVIGLIPGVGDIADILNAGISFYYGRKLEGFLSIIGAIPVVGSAIAIPLKAATKTIGKSNDWLLAAWKNKKSASELWIALKNNPNMDPKMMLQLVEGMDDAADYIAKFRKNNANLLPDAAVKSLDEFSQFLKTNADDAAAILKRTADAPTRGLLKAKQIEKNTAGLTRIFSGKIGRKVKSLFSSALSPKELAALQGAMRAKFMKNMDNPGHLSALIATSSDQAKITEKISKQIGEYTTRLANQPTSQFGNAFQTFSNKFNSLPRGATPTQDAMNKMDLFKREYPDLYQKIYKDVVSDAVDTNNIIYRDFMGREINALGTYFSREYTEYAGIKAAKERWSNMAPVVYNELQDIGEDVAMATGIETEDDINGLFWPALKTLLAGAEQLPVVGGVVTYGRESAEGAASWLGSNSVTSAMLGIAADKTGIGKQRAYDPTQDYQVVSDDDPRLTQKQQQKQQRIQQQKRWF
jgi:hypothetical protein